MINSRSRCDLRNNIFCSRKLAVKRYVCMYIYTQTSYHEKMNPCKNEIIKLPDANVM